MIGLVFLINIMTYLFDIHDFCFPTGNFIAEAPFVSVGIDLNFFVLARKCWQGDGKTNKSK